MTSVPAAYDVDSRTVELIERRSRTFKRRGWLVRRALLASDVLGLVGAFLATEAIVGDRPGPSDQISQSAEYALFIAALPLWVIAAKLYRLYDRDEERTNYSTADEFARVFQLMTINVWLIRVGAYVLQLGRPDFLKLVLFWLFSIVGVSLARAGGRAFCRRQVQYIQNTVIVGTRAAALGFAERVLRHPEYGLNVVGFVATDEDAAAELGHLTIIGGLDELPEIVELLDIERVVVACDKENDPDVIRSLNDMGVQVDIVPRFYEVISSDIDIHMVEGMPVIGVPAFSLSRSSAFLKRGMDVVGAIVGLAVLAPLMLLAAIAIKLDSQGPVLFKQIRMGAGDSTFRILKFRSMTVDAEARKAEFAHLNRHARNGGDVRMFKIEDDPRVTRVGRILRRLSVDELPQLWNVIRGEMSLVGPRPLILEEHAHISDWAERRLDLRPGMTGLWQVLGRDTIPFAEMVRLDYLYVTSWSLGGDLRLMLRTFPAAVTRRL